MTPSQRCLYHFSLLCSDGEGTIKYAQVSPALKKKKKKNVPLLSLVKGRELERERGESGGLILAHILCGNNGSQLQNDLFLHVTYRAL